MTNALELKHVTKKYKDFALEDLNLTLPSGCIMGLIGENGAGKSTTVQLIMNTIHRDCGDIFVLGQDNKNASFSQLKEQIGVVLDEAYFPESITVHDANIILKSTYRQWDTACFEHLIQQFSLPEKKPFRAFSRGMKMKLAIAAALSHHPKLLILDEATSGLDPIIRDEILQIFYDFTRKEDHSILISSHIVSDLEKLCDYIAFLHQGKLLFCEEKDRLTDRYGILKGGQSFFATVPEAAIVSKRVSPYGTEALVKREILPASFQCERPGMEDIILFMSKGASVQ